MNSDIYVTQKQVSQRGCLQFHYAPHLLTQNTLCANCVPTGTDAETGKEEHHPSAAQSLARNTNYPLCDLPCPSRAQGLKKRQAFGQMLSFIPSWAPLAESVTPTLTPHSDIESFLPLPSLQSPDLKFSLSHVFSLSYLSITVSLPPWP